MNSAPAVVEINVVNPDNRAPLATALNLRGPAKKVVPVTLSGSDYNGDALTFRIVSKPSTGKLTGKGSSFKYKPAANFSGVVTFAYVANDGSLESAPTLVTITIDPPAPKVRSIADKSKDVPAVPSSLVVSGSSTRGVVLTLTGPPGQRCTLEHSTDLNIWADLQQVDLPETGVYHLEVIVPEDAPRGFFRLEIPD
ncbi:MAG: hypothetical protein EOP83_32175 [Verrucomicrobiaceae bacterium]|nr:MAG: hypothetical protein EOP83_32175 [Verrucomicrobiaceae bacterium]